MSNNITWSPQLVKNDKPYYLQIVDEMARAITSGKLVVGDKLPAQRQLAWHLNVNLSTVTKAFKLATKRHLISGEVGRGTYVLAQSNEAELYQLAQNQYDGVIDLSTHVPAENSQNKDLETTLKQMLSKPSELNEHLNYLTQPLLKKLQIASSRWLAQFDYRIESDYCLTTSTAQNALLVILLAACNQDDVVLVDELTFPGMKTVAKQLKLKLYGVKLDEQGIVPESLDLAIRSTGAKVLVSDPNMQNPTASIMGAERRTAFIDVIKKHRLLFIEEYVLGTLTSRAPVSCIIQEQSLLITSFAKAVSPGIRFAVIAGKHPFIEKIALDTHATSWQLSPLIAEIACRWIDSSVAKSRLQWQKEEMVRRFRIFKKVFPTKKYLGSRNVTAHVWLPTNREADEVANILKNKGVKVVPSSFFAINHHASQCIRVSLTAAKSLQLLKKALDIIAEANVIMVRNELD